MPAPTGAHGNCIYGQLSASTRPGKRAASPRAGRTGATSPLRDVCPSPGSCRGAMDGADVPAVPGEGGNGYSGVALGEGC